MNKGLFDFVAEFPLAAIVICGLLVLVATLIYRLSKKDMSILEGKFNILEGKFNILESKFSALSTEVKSAFGLIQKDISRIDERLNDHIRETDKKIDRLTDGQARLDSKIEKILEKIK